MISRDLHLIRPETVNISYYCLYDTQEQSKQHKELKVIFTIWGGGGALGKTCTPSYNTLTAQMWKVEIKLKQTCN